jgi:hypothetical protein
LLLTIARTAAQVKVLEGATVCVSFPSETWTRKVSLLPEIVEAHRVLVRAPCHAKADVRTQQ